MKECNHHKYIIQNHKKTFKNYIFNYNAESCSNCNAVLWSQNTENLYQIWLTSLIKIDPEIFNIKTQTSLVCVNILYYLSQDFQIKKEKLIFKLIQFCDYNKLKYNYTIQEDTEITFYFSSEDYRSLDSLTKLSELNQEQILKIAFKVAKQIIDDPELYTFFSAFIFKS